MERRHCLLLGLVLLFQLVLGVQAAVDLDASAFGVAPVLDEEAYIGWGRRIAQGDWLGTRVFGMEPLYPYTLAVVFSVTGGSLLAVRLLQVALGVLATVLTFLVARRMFGAPAGIAAAAVLALYGPLYLFTAEVEKATFTLCVAALFIWVVARAREAKSLTLWGAAGATYGALMLLRGNFVPLLAALLVWVGWRSRSWKLPAAVLAGVVVVLAPVAIRNRVVGGEWVLTTASGGLNFFIGNGPGATGTNRPLEFARLTPLHEIADFEAEASRRVGRKLTPSESSRFWLGEGLRALAADPANAVKLWATKALLAVNAHEVPDNYSFRCARDEIMPSLYLGIVDFGMLVSLALVGVLLARDRSTRWLPFFVLAFATTLVVFFVLARYRVPLLPALAVLAGYGVAQLGAALKRRDWKGLKVAAPALVVALVVTHAPLAQASYGPAHQAHCHDLIGTSWLEAGQFEAAEQHLRQAVTLAPEDAEARYNLGVALQSMGKFDEAEQSYRDAIARRPKHDQAHYNLALLLVRKGQTQEARAHLEIAAQGFIGEKASEALRQLPP